MTTRRAFLASFAAAAGMGAAPGWAAVGSPDFLSAASRADGSCWLAGLTTDGDITFELPLPGRGHAAAAHPHRAEAVAFARRPGTFAVVLDCVTGQPIAELASPEGRHFYGHGAFSPRGDRLFTAENDYEAGVGMIGIWDARRGYARIGEFASGGVGPHDVKLMPDGQTLVIANGGIETHPDAGRTKLNIPVMRPNLALVSLDGKPLEKVELPEALHQNSIRHLALRGDGLVALAMQWEGSLAEHPPLLGLYRRGAGIALVQAGEDDHRRLEGYAGSIAFSANGDLVAITSPRGGVIQVFETGTGRLALVHEADDVCGIGPCGDGFVYTTGEGVIGSVNAGTGRAPITTALRWDNHLVA